MDVVVSGVKTSEFWMGVLAIVNPLIQEFMTGKIDLVSVLIAGLVAVAYLAARIFLKAKALPIPNEE